MYYEERLTDNGFWQYKVTPKGEWHSFTVGMLNRKITYLTQKLKQYETK